MVASQSTSAPLIVVFGSTGNQGGSVIDHLIASKKEYRIKGVTRDPSKPNGQKLKEQDVEPIKADLMNQKDIEAAIKGADYVFGVTNFWEAGAEKEVEQGENLIAAIKATSSSPLFIWSGLPPAKEISGGKHSKVEHFDTKAGLYQLAKKDGIKVINAMPACYMENFATLAAPRKQDDGTFVFGFPYAAKGRVSLIHVRRDYGAFVVAAIEQGKTSGEILATTDEKSFGEMAEIWAKVTGKKCSCAQVPTEQYVSMAGEEMTDMWQYFGDFGYYGGADPKPSQKLVSGTQTWEEFVKEADWSKVIG